MIIVNTFVLVIELTQYLIDSGMLKDGNEKKIYELQVKNINNEIYDKTRDKEVNYELIEKLRDNYIKEIQGEYTTQREYNIRKLAVNIIFKVMENMVYIHKDI